MGKSGMCDYRIKVTTEIEKNCISFPIDGASCKFVGRLKSKCFQFVVVGKKGRYGTFFFSVSYSVLLKRVLIEYACNQIKARDLNSVSMSEFNIEREDQDFE